MPLSEDDLWRGVLRPGEAARTMGIAYDDLLELADREQIDYQLGFHVDDLIRLATALSAKTTDSDQKATLRAAVRTFTAIREHSLAA